MPTVVARWISILGHPFIVLPLVVALTSASIAMTLVLIGVMVVMTFAILRKVSRGDWNDFDVSLLEHRPGAYARAIPLVAAAWLLTSWLRRPTPISWGFGVAIALMVIAAALSRFRLKVSMHAAFASYAASFPVATIPALAAGLAVLALLIAWSRVVLRRHTVAEVIVGVALGAAGGIALHALHGFS
jgi:membrane-associated phospholipid phosphatase